jgi:hypothetical protein
MVREQRNDWAVREVIAYILAIIGSVLLVALLLVDAF